MFITKLLLTQRGTVGAWRNRGDLQVLLEILFTKRSPHKLSGFSTQYLRRSLCLRHLREIVCFHLRALPLSVCLLYVVGLLYHSIFRTNLLSLICTTNMLFERLHQWHQYLFLQLFSINSGVHLISFDLK